MVNPCESKIQEIAKEILKRESKMGSKVVSIHYTLKDKSGTVLESSFGDEPLSYLEDVGQIIPGLEKELKGLKKGDKKVVAVIAAEAYGEHDPSLIVTVAKDALPKKDIKVGDEFYADSNGHTTVVVVTEVGATDVKVDGNHPLAGQDLQFEVEVLEVRDATSEEMAHGHAHGPGGHHHH